MNKARHEQFLKDCVELSKISEEKAKERYDLYLEIDRDINVFKNKLKENGVSEGMIDLMFKCYDKE